MAVQHLASSASGSARPTPTLEDLGSPPNWSREAYRISGASNDLVLPALFRICLLTVQGQQVSSVWSMYTLFADLALAEPWPQFGLSRLGSQVPA